LRRFCIFLFVIGHFSFSAAQSQHDSALHKYWSIEPSFHLGYIVKNSGDVPESNHPSSFQLTIAVQTNGSKDWHHIFGFPEVGCSVFLWDLGNRKELGRMAGIVPNITFNTQADRWYTPHINLGLGLAFFEKQYDYYANPADFYIGSKITAFACASVFVTPSLGQHLNLKTGFMVAHCSNGHYQVPNLGINLPSVFLGFAYAPRQIPKRFVRKDIVVPDSKIRFNIRTGVGVHELADTKGPVLTPKYAIYVNDIYLSKRYGKASNVQLGIEVNHYNSFYNYIVKHDFFSAQQRLKATVMGVFLAHELMISRFSLLTQGGINVYNQFYDKYIERNGNTSDFKNVTKKIFATRLGVQYYLFDPNYCTRSNVFIGAYIKANFGQADFICSQIGFVF
jgi:hypothetical protein